jgi:hypothetical protein
LLVNNKLTPQDVTAGTKKSIFWQCPISLDHVYQTKIQYRTTGKRVCCTNCLAATHPHIASEWHPTKNDCKPIAVLKGSTKKVWWHCSKCEHSWIATINNRTNGGTGCPRCNESKGEKSVTLCLTDMGVLFERQFRFASCKNKRCLPFDFYVKTITGIGLIEYQGEHHYEPIYGQHRLLEKKENDEIKKRWCRKNNIPLLTIPYWQFGQLTTMVKQWVEAIGR